MMVNENESSTKIVPKQRRRGRGEGSIYRRNGDGRWVASFIVEKTGKRKYFYGETRTEVYNQFQRALLEQKQGKFITESQQKLAIYMNQWLEDIHKHTIQPSTYYRYRSVIDKHILPSLGYIHLQKVTAPQIQALYAKKLSEGQAPGSVRKIHQVLHKAFKDALRWNLVSQNVCDAVSPPAREKHEIQTLTQEQVRQLLETAKGHRLECLLILAITTGMRRGEMLGLRWQDIDLEKRTLQVRRTVNRIGKKKMVESRPKTAGSQRQIKLPQLVVEALRVHHTRQVEIRLKAGSKWNENTSVFCNTLGKVFEPAHLVKLFNALLEKAELPHMRFHDLRHTAATLLLTMGVHPKVVQEILGHSSIKMTLDTYSHVIPSMQKDAMDKWDDLWRTQS